MAIAIAALRITAIAMVDGITVMGINMDVSVVAMAALPDVLIETKLV